MTTVGRIPDIVDEPLFGELVAPRDLDALVGALDRVSAGSPDGADRIARFESGLRDWSESAAAPARAGARPSPRSSATAADDDAGEAAADGRRAARAAGGHRRLSAQFSQLRVFNVFAGHAAGDDHRPIAVAAG